MPKDYEIIPFKTQKVWRQWLNNNHAQLDGVWMKLYKKASNIESVTYAEALDEALCFGWIDGQKKSYDEKSYLQKFTPRRKKSLWSKVNVGHISRLTKNNMLMPPGVAEVERAKKDGRWDAAYDPPSQTEMPKEFLKELNKHPKAKAFFKTLNKTNRYAFAWRLQTAKKEETRLKRQDKFIEMLNKGEKL